MTTLIAVTGLSPAIVTETIWALAHEKPRVLPQRVVFITTGTGAAKIREQLHTPLPAFDGQTAWQALRSVLKAKDNELIAEEPRLIGIANKKTGTFDPLPDIQTREENDIAASFILEEVRRVTMNPDTPLIASIAGGRKTMGALLHAAVTLLGRETDRLTHVLVSPPYETLPGFFFPGQLGGPVPTRDAKEKHPPEKARVQLADVPFVPLRNRFDDLREVPGSFSGMVRKWSKTLKADAARPVLIEISYRRKCVWVDDQPAALPKRAIAVFHFLLTRQEKGRSPVDQKEAAERMNRWLVKADFIPLGLKPKEGSITDTAIRHDLSELRKPLAKLGYFLPDRFGQEFPPFTLRLREKEPASH
jgi:CRISPR-associated protein (TIGR02584 family)